MKGIKKLTVWLLAGLMLICTTMPVYAAVRKTVKKQIFTTSTQTIERKASAVKKGTTNFTISKGQGYLKFKAPATKTYSFKFSNLKSKHGISAFVEIQTRSSFDPKNSFLTSVATKGGKNDTLWLAVNGYRDQSIKLVNRRLPVRTGKLRLKKGESVYLYFYNGNIRTTGKLVIK